jgi:5-methylthioadenosine/S-adenosylhomocysteine deaminase
MHVDTLIKAKWIIPVEPHARVYEDHAIAIQSGTIVDILPTDRAIVEFQAAQVEEMPSHALIPGLINTHTHAAMSLMRGNADDLPLMEWLEGHIWPLERRFAGEAFVRDGTDLALAEMIRGGVTCFNDMYFFPEITARQVILSGMRAVVGMILVDFPTNWANGPDEYFSKGLALYDVLKSEPLVGAAFAPHAPYTVSDEPLVRLRTIAEELECSIHMHLHETADEVRQGKASHGMRPIKRLGQLDLLSPRFIAVHMTQLDEEEVSYFAHFGGSIVHCPESNLKLASGFCPVAKLLDAGINVALGTDGPASNNDLDVLGEMKTAALLAKGVACDARAVPAATALRMATLNGAKALGLDSEIGSLEAGKSADIVALDLGDIETQPLFDPISDIVYAASRHQVTGVWVAGRRLLNKRELTTLDRDDITARAVAWRDRLNTNNNSV